MLLQIATILFSHCILSGNCSPLSSHSIRSEVGRPIVDIGYAAYEGVRLPIGVDQYLGIRYAQAPLGNLRFRAPRDPQPEQSIQDASKYQPTCIGTGQALSESISEDCLFVNIFKPSRAKEGSDLPVWVYIQGGGYATNSNANYNGTNVVQQSDDNIVLVNFNYRVGALGFLASQEVKSHGDLNVGLLDQRLLLHWVQDHIRKFGGNPKHVVIHGASAGAGSVSHHLTAYRGQKDNDLFVGAIPESPFWPTLRTVTEAESQYSMLLRNTNCSSLACLRTIGLAEFQAASPSAPFIGAASDNPLPLWYWLPVVDGSLVPDHMYSLFEKGHFIKVPLMVGDDTDEGSYFAYDASNSSEMTTFLKNNYPNMGPDQLDHISQAYSLMPPLPGHNTWFPSASAAYGDATFTCPGNEMTATMSKWFSSNQVWNYRFNVLDPVNLASGLGVPHTFETSAIFGVGYAGDAAESYSTINAGILPITMHYFISFIETLNPNTHKLFSAPEWQPWGRGKGQRIRLQTNNTDMESIPQHLLKKCELWKGLGASMEI